MEKLSKVAVHSVPRSGSTWLGSLIDAHPKVIYKFQPLFSYKYKGYLTQTSTKEKIETFFDLISKDEEDEFINQLVSKDKGLIPIFEKAKSKYIVYKEVRYHYILENLLRQLEDIYVIGLIRNPFEVLYSWYMAPSEFCQDKDCKFKDEWLFANRKNNNRKEEYFGFKKWLEVTMMFIDLHKKYKGKFYLLSYNDLLKNTEKTLQEIMYFIGEEINPQQIKWLKKIKLDQSEYNYKGVMNKNFRGQEWNIFLTQEMVNHINGEIEKNKEVKNFLTSLNLI